MDLRNSLLSVGMVAFLEVFGYRIPKKWIRIGVLASLGVGSLKIYIGPEDILFSVASICLQLVLIGVIIASWKRLKGPQWAVVVGMGITGLFAALIAILLLTKTYYFGNMYISSILTSGLVLSLPLSFLIYLVLRFKETLAEVRTNAAAVVLVTEEKRDLLASQNEQLEQQVEARTAELKASQQQLIQKEKMASLGELTAGIAHEIQNPLNFVTNFSEVSTELIEELQEEHQSPTRDAELEAELLSDLKDNLLKITQHGQRAASIVKGMLEHSRSSTGEREPTDLNALANKFLRLAYQGQRSKNKDFKVDLKTDFLFDLGLAEVVPQEIGRVLLNLYNNAFYAVQQRRKNLQGLKDLTGLDDYQPTVTVSTRKVGRGVEVEVRDNGTGMADSVRQKVFQPFFTTKPTGEGTGLGLSLSYDIVTKGHGGTLTVNSQEREGTEFVITLPAYA